MITECVFNCNGLGEIRANHNVDSFVTMVLGGVVGKLVDHDLTRSEILSIVNFLFDQIQIAQESPATRDALDAFADSIKISEQQGNG